MRFGAPSDCRRSRPKWRRTAWPWKWIPNGASSPPRSRRQPPSSRPAPARSSFFTTSKATRTRRSLRSWASPQADQNHNCSKRARSCASCARISLKYLKETRGGWNMSHLSAERLAALVEEAPTAAELSHLASCADCSRERRAYESLSEMARNGVALGTPLTSWNRLAPRLRDDGVIDTGRGFGRRAVRSRVWLQAAAAVLLVAGGVAAGRVTAPAASAAASLASSDSAPVFQTVADARAAAARS